MSISDETKRRRDLEFAVSAVLGAMDAYLGCNRPMPLHVAKRHRDMLERALRASMKEGQADGTRSNDG